MEAKSKAASGKYMTHGHACQPSLKVLTKENFEIYVCPSTYR